MRKGDGPILSMKMHIKSKMIILNEIIIIFFGYNLSAKIVSGNKEV
jgi:hypothetical protein